MFTQTSKRFLAAVAGSVGMLAIAASVNAAAIGIQVTSAQDDAAFSLEASGEVAGVVAQGNWNTLIDPTATDSTLHDSNGDAVAGMSVTFSGFGAYTANSSMSDGDFKLSRYMYFVYGGGSEATVQITGIPYANYDVYVYGTNDSPAEYSDKHTSFYDGSTYVSFEVTNNATEWTEGTGTWDGTGTAPAEDVATYAKFSGKAGASFTLTYKSQGNSGVNGIQIVEVVPEPASLALVGMGMLVMLRRRH